MPDEIVLSVRDGEELASRACRAAGADDATSRSLVAATLSAALFGPATLGFPHLVDYLNGFRDGRINPAPKPGRESIYPAYIESDADVGIAQLGFDLAFDDLVAAARGFGIALFTQTNSYTAGELGYYVRRLTEKGLAGIAATNANAMMVAKPGGPSVYGTNPLAFGFPLGEGSPPMVIDQASSATAFVNIVAAAQAGGRIPEGWAVDRNGKATVDAAAALHGALLPFGGRKGANVALMVEMLSAGLSGGPWSLDAPDFRSGTASPSIGLTVMAITPGSSRRNNVPRAREQSERLQRLGVFMPGVTGIEHPMPASMDVRMPRGVFEIISRIAAA